MEEILSQRQDIQDLLETTITCYTKTIEQTTIYTKTVKPTTSYTREAESTTTSGARTKSAKTGGARKTVTSSSGDGLVMVIDSKVNKGEKEFL